MYYTTIIRDKETHYVVQSDIIGTQTIYDTNQHSMYSNTRRDTQRRTVCMYEYTKEYSEIRGIYSGIHRYTITMNVLTNDTWDAPKV